MFIQGKEHDWVELNKKFPVQCRYCSGFIQGRVSYAMYAYLYGVCIAPLRAGYVCTVCRIAVHTKCQKSVPYCSGVSILLDIALNEHTVFLIGSSNS